MSIHHHHFTNALPLMVTSGAIGLGAMEASAGQAGAVRLTEAPGPTWIVLGLIGLFAVGLVQSIRTYLRARRTIREEIEPPKPSLASIQATADSLGRPLPFVVILVPARNEVAVICNTIQRLSRLDYPPERYAFVVITDDREGGTGSLPTTHAMAVAAAAQLNPGRSSPFLHVIRVPEWYSGRFRDSARSHARSTKGRALNFALDYVLRDPELRHADMLGVVDADGRLHKDVLREVAHAVLTRGARLLQGPVFQVFNLPDVGLMGKAAGIELSMFHLSTLARQLKSDRDTARFLAGTNYFIDPHLMVAVGGWNQDALVEDAELGLRLYLEKQVRPAWLSCHEVEQTPPDVRSYLRQRERWALGHLQLLPIIRRSALPWHAKVSLYGKVLHGMLMCPFDVGLPVLAWLALAMGWTRAMPEGLGWVMTALLVGSVFVWDYFGRGLRLLNRYAPRPMSRRTTWVWGLCFIAAMPLLMVLQALPRMMAFGKYVTGVYSRDWQKTPRTAEPSRESLRAPSLSGTSTAMACTPATVVGPLEGTQVGA